MKDYSSRQSTPKLEAYLNEAIENRGADYAIVISKKSSSLSKEVGLFQEYGNKLFVALTTVHFEKPQKPRKAAQKPRKAAKPLDSAWKSRFSGFSRHFGGFSRLLRLFKMYSGQCNTL